MSIAAREVGGDYYDFFDLGEGTLGVVLADVSGKGVASAMLMANLQASFRSQLDLAAKDPLGLLRRVNQLFFEATSAEHYATLFFGIYQESSRQLRYVNAGHPAPALLRANGDRHSLTSTAMVLGLMPVWNPEEATVDLGPGDKLLIYSDGLSEAEHVQPGGGSTKEYGEAQLWQALTDLRQYQPVPLLQAMVDDVRDFSGTAPTDDLTLLLLSAR